MNRMRISFVMLLRHFMREAVLLKALGSVASFLRNSQFYS
jgi:hypothetical protein